MCVGIKFGYFNIMKEVIINKSYNNTIPTIEEGTKAA